MTIYDRKQLQEIMMQFSKFNGNEFKVLSVDVKHDFVISFVDGYEIEDQNKNLFKSVVIKDELDDEGSLMYLDKIHEIQVLNLGYILIEKKKKKYHTYAGCSIKTYPGNRGVSFLNIIDMKGTFIEGFPLNEVLTVDYNEDNKSIVITFRTGKPAFKYYWNNEYVNNV